MLLAIDIGNSNITLGVFDGQRLSCTARLSSESFRSADEYGELALNILKRKGVEPQSIRAAVICSVVPRLTSTFEEACLEYLDLKPLTVNTGVKTGVRILYENPRDVGADRVADAAAAFWLYGGPTIVVDFGTGTVFDAISGEGDYLGGAIAPGIEVAAEALHQTTSQLRRVDAAMPRKAIGRNTPEALQSGLMLGYVGLVEGMVRRFKQEIGAEAKVIATGGLAKVMAGATTIFDATNPDLTLIGLRLIYEMNRGPGEGSQGD